MKKLSFVFYSIIAAVLFAGTLAAQNKTIILVRHAEKDAAQSETSSDPELSVEGKQRAERLAKRIKGYRPGAVFSTDYKRTRDTVAPTAKRRKLTVQIYDAAKPKELMDSIMQNKIKRFVIAGHSNTVPGLVNLIGKKPLFKNLDDAEFGVIWVIRIKNGQVEKVEILNY